MVTLASNIITAKVLAQGITSSTGAGTWRVDTSSLTDWSLTGWLEVSREDATTFVLACALGASGDTGLADDYARGSLGMDANVSRYGRLYGQPGSSNITGETPGYLLGQGMTHLAMTVEQVSGDTRRITFYVNGVPVMDHEITAAAPTADVLHIGASGLTGAISGTDKVANCAFHRSALTDAEVSALYLSERAALGVAQPDTLVIGSFDSLTAFSQAPFWKAAADASLRPGTHFALEGRGGSFHGGGADLTGSMANYYNSPERQGLRRRTLDYGSRHYGRVVWLCMYGTNDMGGVGRQMDPGSTTWQAGRDVIDGMIFRDVATATNSGRIVPVLLTMPPHGGWCRDWLDDGSPSTIAAASAGDPQRWLASQEYNNNCRTDFAGRGYAHLVDFDAYVPAGFASMQAAALDAFTNGDNSIFLSGGLHFSDAGGAELAANVLTPFLAGLT